MSFLKFITSITRKSRKITVTVNLINNYSTSLTGNPLMHRTLTRNPLNCDCNLRWFPAFRDGSIQAVNAIGACSLPDYLNGVNIYNLTEEQFVCGK